MVLPFANKFPTDNELTVKFPVVDRLPMLNSVFVVKLAIVAFVVFVLPTPVNVPATFIALLVPNIRVAIEMFALPLEVKFPVMNAPFPYIYDPVEILFAVMFPLIITASVTVKFPKVALPVIVDTLVVTALAITLPIVKFPVTTTPVTIMFDIEIFPNIVFVILTCPVLDVKTCKIFAVLVREFETIKFPALSIDIPGL
ncbi:hypothetical protein PBCV1_a026R [Paramecium bursaria Chlorella virus 1]|uniref:Uncharacterized protein n=1 Tax=Paramecium bursaria Chlorella virus 1 TaxID=10506 RepID=Q89361_PBCV1|nr:hypothetical protein PBCV1_a026R [Paramecium bursaria Chlorella virus 1]AAC96394.1 hypothetical protein [Paramecium bursaria Chlorella virus 1]